MMIKVLHILIYWIHKLWSKTWRIKIALPQHTHIMGCWHEDIPTMLRVLGRQDYHVQVSLSQDGNLMTSLFEQWGYQCYRGSNSQGFNSIRSCLKALNNNHKVAMALDGPKGPRGEIQPGSQWLSQRGQTPFYIAQVSYQSTWRLNTWDQMAWPKPFSKIEIKFIPQVSN